MLAIVIMNGANAVESAEVCRTVVELANDGIAARTIMYQGKVVMFAIGRDITERKRTDEDLRKAHEELEGRMEECTAELRIRTGELEEVNSALRVLLKRREEDKRELEENVLCNVKALIAPCVERLKKSGLDERQSACVSVLESNIGGIIAPFSRRLSSKYFSLTPAEIQIADLITQGKSTKEIAQFLNLSSKTIECHRKNIRKKMKLKNKKANLRIHLLSLA